MGLFTTLLIGVLFLISFVVVWLFLALRQRAAFYKKHNVPYIGARFWQTLRDMVSGNMNLMVIEKALYVTSKKENAPLVAFSDISGQSSLMIMDLDLMKKMMVKDFDHFLNNRSFDVKSSKYFAKMMFVMRDDIWKEMRRRMTPAFSTGKIKRMYRLLIASSEKMNVYLKTQMGYPNTKTMDVDFSKVLFKYSMNVIASTAFGIDSRGYETPLNDFSTFEKFGKQIELKFGAKEMLKIIVLSMSPRLAEMLGMDFLDEEAQTYFANVVKDVLKQRRQTGERREDFLQLMIDIQSGILKAEEEDGGESSTDTIDFNDDYLIANALMFFIGGFEQTTTALLFSVYSLALEQDAQEKLYREVKGVVDKNGGRVTYDGLFEMPYLDMVIAETMRIYPSATRADRECTQDYVVEETGFKIEKGTVVVFPIHGIHKDEQYYPEPDKFKPERFSQEEKAKRHPYAHMPFGYGPRSCIAMRFMLVMIKAVVAQLISEFKLDVCDKTTIPMKFSGTASAKPVDGMWLKVSVREA